VDTTHVAVPRETGTDERSGVVNKDDGSRSRGNKGATWRTWVAHAGLITPVGLCPLQGHDLPCGRLCCETTPVWRAGAVFGEDQGLVDGATLTVLQPQRSVAGLVPLQGKIVVERSGATGPESRGVAAPSRPRPPAPRLCQRRCASVGGVSGAPQCLYEALWEPAKGGMGP
jgi:hypothetical protein